MCQTALVWQDIPCSLITCAKVAEPDNVMSCRAPIIFCTSCLHTSRGEDRGSLTKEVLRFIWCLFLCYTLFCKHYFLLLTVFASCGRLGGGGRRSWQGLPLSPELPFKAQESGEQAEGAKWNGAITVSTQWHEDMAESDMNKHLLDWILTAGSTGMRPAVYGSDYLVCWNWLCLA